MKKHKVTIYTTGEFFGSVHKIEAYLIEHGRRPYAQYDQARFVVFVPRGKRKPRTILKGYKPYILIVEGWNAPEPPGMYGAPERSESGAIIRKSQYRSFDDRYKTDFDRVIDSAGVRVVADYREKSQYVNPDGSARYTGPEVGAC